MNASARCDRAYRAIHKLYEQGRLYQNATVVQRQEWDRQMQVALLEHCNEDAINIYLLNTGRQGPETVPLADHRYEDALRQVADMVSSDFYHRLK